LNGAYDPLARVVFAALVLASFAAFGITQRLKHTPTVIQDVRLSASFVPGSKASNGVERLSFKLQHSDRVTVTVIDSRGDTVRTLARHLAMPPYKRFSFYWNGHEAHGRHAPPGTYRVKIGLARQRREILLPAAFELLGRGSSR
jgi:flagellar hook assembly protein FlgD